ncbi:MULTISPECIES: exodeoxyribonuclease VII large subunit [Terrabacteria group]|uniref:exodeoxyribonuclease VII large subunit n=1 Tax=Bacillati TaxID=1783272 RepID=UPI001C6E4E51|nr:MULTISPECIES: exodeoxyribonuclease VII large subunit [Terrabacteria group]MBW9211803.1 exodeoxyribonuclease VII large subunit [Trueperella sp. zg.1013]
MSENIHSVSAVSKRIKALLERDVALHNFLMEGEISNFRASKHWYFSLKDEQASINCAIWNSTISHINFVPKNGDKVVVKCSLGVYVPSTSITLTITAMRKQGIGDLMLQLEALKKKLSGEGLFNPEHKKPLPKYPLEIGIITGKDTAGKADMVRTLNLRWSMAKQFFYECPVQSQSSIPLIVEAIKKADQSKHDVLILARGGGSFEDLFIFNDEQLVRTVYETKTAIVTGIGHETDTTLVDYVADLRANTPTGAAEAVTPNQAEIHQSLRHVSMRLIQRMLACLSLIQENLNHLNKNTYFQNPELLTRDKSYQLDQYLLRLSKQKETLLEIRNQYKQLTHRFEASLLQQSRFYQNQIQDYQNRIKQNIQEQSLENNHNLKQRKEELNKAINHYSAIQNKEYSHLIQLLDAYSPLKILDRGYSVALKEERVVRSIHAIEVGDKIKLRFSDGFIQTQVQTKEKTWKN